MRLIFATNNKHKLEEVAEKLANTDNPIEVVSLSEMNFHEDIPETGETLKANAFQKAETIFKRFGQPCFADDTGLEIEALNGEPGVFSARYAGEGCSFEENVKKVLRLMEGKTNRRASFKTVIALILSETEVHYFEGCIEGKITEEPHGEKGFGYDPIFCPDGYAVTFAELPLNEKNRISHRGLAMEKFIAFLNAKF